MVQKAAPMGTRKRSKRIKRSIPPMIIMRPLGGGEERLGTVRRIARNRLLGQSRGGYLVAWWLLDLGRNPERLFLSNRRRRHRYYLVGYVLCRYRVFGEEGVIL